jgi:hypothetical protein
MAAIAIEPPPVLGCAIRELHKADRRFHEKTRQIDRIADGHGRYEQEFEKLGRELACR